MYGKVKSSKSITCTKFAACRIINSINSWNSILGFTLQNDGEVLMTYKKYDNVIFQSYGVTTFLLYNSGFSST